MIGISKYSGRCDLYDTLEIYNYTLDELQNNVTIYIGKNSDELHINSMYDLIPYYPYIITSAAFNNKERRAAISLSTEPCTDIEERQLLEFYKTEFVKMYKRCKRQKREFYLKSAKEMVSLFNETYTDTLTELAKRVKENGSRADINGLHLPMYENCRKQLVEEMVNNGLNPADYGYGRFCE